MAFSLKQLSEIIGVNHNRCRQWVAMGYLVPSIKKSAVKGSNNLFDRFDLYRAAMLNHLIEFGWSRETVSKMIAAISDDTSWKVNYTWLAPERVVHQAALAGEDFTADLYDAAPEIREAARIALVEALAERIPKRKIYLIFLLNLPLSIHCTPLCDNSPIINGKPLMGDIMDAPDFLKMANDAHIIEMSPILRKVDDSLFLRYPKVFAEEIQNVLNARKDPHHAKA